MTPQLRSALIGGLLSMAVASGPAAAATYNWDFGSLLSGSFTPSGTFASMSATTADNMHFTFDLKAKDLNALFRTGAFFSALSVADSAVGKAADPKSVALAPGVWGVTQVGLKQNASGPGGKTVWDFDFSFPATGANGGAARLMANEEVKWLATFAAPITFNNPAFAIHVQGMGSALGGSAWYTSLTSPTVSPIPEPETYAMLLAGLSLMVFVARRRQRGLDA